MRYYLVTALASAVIAGGIVSAAYSIKEVSKVGSCGNGQVVVNNNYSSKPCPEGIGTLIGFTAGGIIAAIVGVFLFVMRGSAPGSVRRRPAKPVPAVMGAYSGSGPPSPGSSGARPAYTPPQPKPPPVTPTAGATPPPATPTPDPSALPTMPSVPPIPGLSTPASTASAPSPPPAAAGGSTEDPVAQLAKLDKLREQGVLSESEFAEAKRRVLGEL